ncbi:MAG: hypothetical protein IV100_14775 [Myxococcales bacterium]|nr:hypothetical protein [Myxococcales bacterium]
MACDGRVGPTGLTSLGAGVATTVLDGGVFYIGLDVFGIYVDGEFVDGPVITALRAAFEQATAYDAAILDLRANPGGYVTIYVELAAWVSAEPILLYSCRNKVGPGPDDFTDRYDYYSTPDGSLQFDGKLAIFASARSFSAADFTTQWMGATGAGRARVFGAPTGGGFGSGPATPLGQGWNAAMNNLECVNAEGVPLEGNAPPVDQPVSYTRQDIIDGVDTIVEAARAWALLP